MPNIKQPPEHADSPIRVVVAPSQSSYFAGEVCSVTITFTNTHSPHAAPIPPSRNASYTHKRGSHSISSAPLARPPTSPGIPRSPVLPSAHLRRSKPEMEIPSRKGFVGKRVSNHEMAQDGIRMQRHTRVQERNEDQTRGKEKEHGREREQGASKSGAKGNLPELIEQRRKRLLAKSLSVSISPRELQVQLPEGTLAKTGSSSSSTPNLPALGSLGIISESQPSSLSSSSSSVQLVSETASPAVETPSTTTSTAASSPVMSPTVDGLDGSGSYVFPPPSLSSSSFQPIGLGPPPKGSRSGLNAATTTTTAVSTGRHLQAPSVQSLPPLYSAPPYLQPSKSQPLHPYRPSMSPPPPPPPLPSSSSSPSLQAPSPRFHYQHPRTAVSSTFPHPKSELILYAYAQLAGSLTLVPLPGTSSTPEQSHTLRALRTALLRRSVVGGGSMDITPSLQKMHSHGRSPSLNLSKSPGLVRNGSDYGETNRANATGTASAGASQQQQQQNTTHTRPPRPRIRASHARSPSLAAGFFSALLSPTSLVSPLAPSSSHSPLSPFPPSPLVPSGSSVPPSSIHPMSSIPSGNENGKFVLGGTSRSVSSAGRTPGHKAGGASVSGVARLASSGPSYAEEVTGLDLDPEAPLPTFEVQPAMLAVDLSLSPGESRSYTYSIKLPDILPPTFRGRSVRFSYELIIGVCRAGGGTLSFSSPPSLSSASGVSRVMKVPIRVYNNVVVGRVPRPYDLLWPVGRRIRERAAAATAANSGKNKRGQEKGDLERGLVVEECKTLSRTSTPLPSTPVDRGRAGTLGELREYANRMLALSGDDKGRRPRVDGVEDNDVREEEGPIGCREAVEILTRNPKKVSYDVNKDGLNVAVLTFTKSAYRLGETVLGVVEFNERRGRARVLQMSAMLEAHEKLPSNISSSPPDSVYMKRIHAEQHQSFVMSILRSTFSLDIPSDASPAFQIGVGEDDDSVLGGLEWKVRLCLLVAVAADESSVGTEGVRMKGMVRDGPRGVWGSAWYASENVAPMEKGDEKSERTEWQALGSNEEGGGVGGWVSYLASRLLGPSTPEEAYHDGDELFGDVEDEEEYDGIKADPAGGVGRGVNYGGGEEGWTEIGIEMVECEVPIRVWPGNTAFKAAEVVFEL
ncbi:hypothetical protein AX17_002019 [Amanita inopinata Kibby_2008]|nr:hypothetical protein AX17_002019 [Amanita inopinata Kibby_2008]